MYKIKYTERNNNKAHDYETKSLLYLLTLRDDSQNIDLLFIDCFNDITGYNENSSELWDTQAKGVSSLNPKKIGIALITLFENYSSELDFTHFILVLPKQKDIYVEKQIDSGFSYQNFKEGKRDKIIEGLKEEYLRRNHEANREELMVLIKDFLEKVLFVYGQEKEAYIKEVIQFKETDKISDSFYIKIFDEIRDKQSSLKNINIEGVKIQHPKDLLTHNKLIRSNEIKLLVLNRIIGNDLYSTNTVPISYIGEIASFEDEDKKDQVEDNKACISRTLFNKNNRVSFWRLLENIVSILLKDKKQNIRNVIKQIEPKLINMNTTMDFQSTLYLIALLKDGFAYDN